ncbi:MAG: FkbM family methyltransferase [Pseudomonadota bacterium]
MRHPTKDDCFKTLKSIGAPIGTILDVGVKTCTYELLRAFPDHHHVLMEPIVEYNDEMRRNYERTNTSFEVINAAICDRDGGVRLKTTTVYADKPISHARITDDNVEDDDHRVVPSMTLDGIVATRELKDPFLLKVDVDGAELLVLKGAKEALRRTSVVVIETGFANMVERAAALLAEGFEVFDVVDISYYNDRFVQADMVFIRCDIVRDRQLEVYRDGFDVAKWQPYMPNNP